MTRPLLRIFLLAGAIAFHSPSAAAATLPDWSAAATVNTVEIVTKNADGTLKETTVWLVVVDGDGYIRTGNTRWWSNIERDHDVVLRIEGKDYPLRVVLVEDPDLRQRVVDAFRAKYGWLDRAVDAFRSGTPHVMKLSPRTQEGAS
jgi:hypothetical protein